MTKRLIDVDDGLLTEAREVLGASTWKETVNRALAEVVAHRHRTTFHELLASGRFDDLGDPDVMGDAWAG